jgi:hypothetical protein
MTDDKGNSHGVPPESVSVLEAPVGAVELVRNIDGIGNLFAEVEGESFRALRCPSCSSMDKTYFEGLESLWDEGFILSFSCGICSGVFELSFSCDRDALLKTKVSLFSTPLTRADEA